MAGVTPIVNDGMTEVRVLTTFAGTLTTTAFEAGIDITCDLTGDGVARSLSEETVTVDQLCKAQVGEQPGSYTESLDLTYHWNPQDEGTESAYATLVPGTKKFIAIRYGVPYGTAAAAGQVVDVIEAVPGQRQRVATGRNETTKSTQKMFVQAGGTHYDVALTSA